MKNGFLVPFVQWLGHRLFMSKTRFDRGRYTSVLVPEQVRLEERSSVPGSSFGGKECYRCSAKVTGSGIPSRAGETESREDRSKALGLYLGGVKCDVVPGRLNQISILVQREGVYYGQCSEICGTNHAFMRAPGNKGRLLSPLWLSRTTRGASHPRSKLLQRAAGAVGSRGARQ
ncbi:hypothetical protein ACOSQ3_016934 [Xanthoceras sorbifolium]